MRIALVVCCTLSVSCIGRLTAALNEATAGPPPPWAEAAQKNLEAGEPAYAQRVAEAPKRGPQDKVTIAFCIDMGLVYAMVKNELRPQEQRYPDSAFVPSLGTSVNEIFYGLQGGWTRATPPVFSADTAKGQYCPEAPGWYESAAGMRLQADVYVWMRVELVGNPQCPRGRGVRVNVHWSSAYERQDLTTNVDFCPGPGEEGGRAVAAAVFPRIESEVRPRLPATAEVVRLTPPYRWEWWRWQVEHGGGGSHHGGHHHH